MKKLYLNPLKGMSKASESDGVEFGLVFIGAIGIVAAFFMAAMAFIAWEMGTVGARALIVATVLSYAPNILSISVSNNVQ